ncbi:MAG: Ppx/GppA family phosphatase [Rhodospirillales bacterium]|nr:MAG: Ppx/GppA family phosphatase [Rhodospirillales bacterium]
MAVGDHERIRTGPSPAAAAARRVGVVDIGSNTVRLVVYETPNRLPMPIFNEKAQCGLGRSIGKSGRLSPRGITEALRSLARFGRLAEAMAVGHLEILATAAVRDAADGRAFVAEAERVTGRPVHVLSGAEEARLAAVGLLNGVPGADGALGDLGGGSLDLVSLETGTIGAFATLPVGHLRLAEDSGGDRTAARRRVDEALAGVPWLEATAGRTFYAVGGSWRALARIFIEQTHHPLHVLDNYTIDFFDALRLADLIAGLSLNTLQTLSSLTHRRIDTLPFAAAAMAGILERARPARVAFSGFGMREGQMLELLPEGLRRQDPLISACEGQAERSGRFAQRGQEMLDWMAPLFPAETADQRRLRLAACLLSDIGWSEHPDYRAEHAFHRVLRVPYPGLSHPERAALALAVFARYGGAPEHPMTAPTARLLDAAAVSRAVIVGLALRLAHTLTGGAPGLLPQTRLKVEKDRLVLCLPDDAAVFLSDAVDRRFKQLAAAVGLKPRIG